jgi:hypothetical protein
MSDTSRGATVLLFVFLAGFAIYVYPTVLANVAALGVGGGFLAVVLPLVWIMVIAVLLIVALYTLIR